MHPVGVRLSYNRETVHFDLWVMPVVGGGAGQTSRTVTFQSVNSAAAAGANRFFTVRGDGNGVGAEDTFADSWSENEHLYLANLYWDLIGISEKSRLMSLAAYMAGGSRFSGVEGTVLGQNVGGIPVVRTINDAGGALSGRSPVGLDPDQAGQDADIWTLGIGVLLKDIGTPGLELFGEVYYQSGDAGHATNDDLLRTDLTPLEIAQQPQLFQIGGVPSGGNTAANFSDLVMTNTGLPYGNHPSEVLDHEAWAFQIGFRYDALQTAGKPWIDVSYTFRTGDENLTDGKHQNFLSYEDVDDLAIIEGNDLGLDVDTNYWAFKTAGGLHFATVGGHSDNVSLSGILGFAGFDEDIPRSPFVAPGGGKEEGLGAELDIKVGYAYNDALSFNALLGILMSADALKAFTVDDDDDAWLFNAGMNLKF
jgi:hypothetical protein